MGWGSRPRARVAGQREHECGCGGTRRARPLAHAGSSRMRKPAAEPRPARGARACAGRPTHSPDANRGGIIRVGPVQNCPIPGQQEPAARGDPARAERLSEALPLAWSRLSSDLGTLRSSRRAALRRSFGVPACSRHVDLRNRGARCSAADPDASLDQHRTRGRTGPPARPGRPRPTPGLLLRGGSGIHGSRASRAS